MRQTQPPVDASTLIYLAKADAFDELAGFLPTLLVTPAVWREAVEQGEERAAREVQRIRDAESKGQLRRVPVNEEDRRRVRQIRTDYGLGAGESEALVAAEAGGVVIIDEGRASRVASDLGLVPISTLFLPLWGRRSGALTAARARKLLHRLAAPTGVRGDVLLELERRLEES